MKGHILGSIALITVVAIAGCDYEEEQFVQETTIQESNLVSMDEESVRETTVMVFQSQEDEDSGMTERMIPITVSFPMERQDGEWYISKPTLTGSPYSEYAFQAACKKAWADFGLPLVQQHSARYGYAPSELFASATDCHHIYDPDG